MDSEIHSANSVIGAVGAGRDEYSYVRPFPATSVHSLQRISARETLKKTS